MNRVDGLFLRVYVKLIAAMLIGAILVRIFVVPMMDARVGRNIEETFSTSVAVMAEMLAEDQREHRDARATLERASTRFRVAAATVPRGEVRLAASELSRLDGGEVVRTGEPFSSIIWSRIGETDQVLRIGPINSVHPWGGIRGAAGLSVLALALTLGVYALLWPIRRRLTALAGAAAALGRGELTVRAEVGSTDAIGTVAAAFNKMAGDLQRLISRQEELLHMTSHELRTPMQQMHFALERLRDSGAAESVVERMERDLAEMDVLIEELLTYVRLKERRADVWTAVDMADLSAGLCEDLAYTTRGITLVPPDAPIGTFVVEGDARLLRRAVSNLVVNALRHGRSRVVVTITGEAGLVHVQVDDDGPGIPEADRERVFEPFVRLEGQEGGGAGFGLGLAIVRRIAELHGGRVAAAFSALGGAELRLSLRERAGPSEGGL